MLHSCPLTQSVWPLLLSLVFKVGKPDAPALQGWVVEVGWGKNVNKTPQASQWRESRALEQERSTAQGLRQQALKANRPCLNLCPAAYLLCDPK